MGGQGRADTVKTYLGFHVPDDFEPVPDHPSESREGLYPATVRMARRFLHVSNIDVTVYGTEHIPATGGALLAGNHTGYYDFILAAVGPHLRGQRLVRYMAKKSVFDVKLLGPILRRMRHVPVDRKRGGSSIDAAVHELQDGMLVGIFPEATISRSFELANFKTGAARIAYAADAPLVPCVIWGSQRLWTKDLPKRFRNVPVIIRYGAPVELTGDAEADTARLKADMQALLDTTRAEYAEAHGSGEGEAWMPVALGGTAPTVEEADEIYRLERAAREEKKAKKARRKGRR